MLGAASKIFGKIYIDWLLFLPALLISLAGLVTMNSFSGDDYFFSRQSIWLLVSVGIFLAASAMDWRFLRQTKAVVSVFLGIVGVLVILLAIGEITRGAQSWFQLGAFAFQPADPAKIAVILMLAKYFSRRHIEIRNIRHIVVSAVYALIIFSLVFLQPDFGSAMVILGIWFGMVLVSGISKKHLALVFILGAAASAILWAFVFDDFQKNRIISFIDPLSDIRGTGYHAYQSTVAVGSGGFLGKGIGQGSQSKLKFLPEYQTDFIFAAFAEEWGVLGASILLGICLFLLWMIVNKAQSAPSNFETLFGLGVAAMFTIHILVVGGMNLGIMPITGITFPFMSYGGSHLITEWLALGIFAGMSRGSRVPRVEL